MQGKSTTVRSRRRLRSAARWWGGTTGAACLLAALAAPAAPPLPPIQARSDQLAPGTWVSYAVLNVASGEAALVRMAALEREGRGQWFEIGITDQRQRRLVLKTLVEGPLDRPRRILKGIVQPPDQRPLVLPEELVAKQMPTFRAGQEKGARLLGTVKVKVAGGSFKARHFRRRHKDGTEEDSWISDQIPGWPMVKFETQRVHLELTGHGKDARSQIEGHPVKLDPRLLR